jgi:hypothetical protein
VPLFLTGLGTNSVTPQVTVDDMNAPVTYAGPAPGLGTVVVTVKDHASNHQSGNESGNLDEKVRTRMARSQ